MFNLAKREHNDNLSPIKSLHNKIDNLLNNFLSDTSSDFVDYFNTRNAFYPKVNISEDNKAFYLEADLAGVKKEDVKVEYREDGTLSVSAEKKEERREDKKNYHYAEYASGSFYRSFQLPNNVNMEGVNAEMKDGMLKVVLPKNNTKSTQINVK